MKNEDYFDLALSSLKTIKGNFRLYIPDLLFYLVTTLLSFLFLHVNGLTSIFSGEITIFKEQIKTIVSSSPSFIKLILSLSFSLFFSLVFGLGTTTLKFTMIKNILKKKKLTFFETYLNSHHYLLRTFLLKLCFSLLYLVPAFLLLGTGLLSRPFLGINAFFTLLLFFMFEFLFLFSYALAFLDDLKNPFNIIKKSVYYCLENKIHTLITGIFVLFFSALFTLFFTVLPLLLSKLGIFAKLSILTLVFLILKTIIELTVNLWSSLFIFKNYKH